MVTPKIINILKVADFNIDDISEELRKFIKGFIWYEDTVLSEDLYSPADAMDSDHFHKLSKEAQAELRRIVTLCSFEDCAYVRFIEERPEQRIDKIIFHSGKN